MPQPIEINVRIVRELDDSHYILIGKVISEWAKLELRLAYAIGMISQIKLRCVLFMFENMTMKAKLDAADSIVNLECIEDFPYIKDTILPLLPRIRILSAYRNTAAHAAWLGLTPTGHMACADINARSEGGKIGRRTFRKDEFESAIRSIAEITATLKEFAEEFGSRCSGYEVDFS